QDQDFHEHVLRGSKLSAPEPLQHYLGLTLGYIDSGKRFRAAIAHAVGPKACHLSGLQGLQGAKIVKDNWLGDLDSNQDCRTQSAPRPIDPRRFFPKPSLKRSSKHQWLPLDFQPKGGWVPGVTDIEEGRRTDFSRRHS